MKSLLLNRTVKNLLLTTTKACGAKVQAIMGYIDEQITPKEYKEIEAFLTWSFSNEKLFGHGNYEERVSEFTKRSRTPRSLQYRERPGQGR